MLLLPPLYSPRIAHTHNHTNKQPGDEDFLTAALTKNPKAFIEADLGLLLVPPTDKSSYIGMCVCVRVYVCVCM